MVRVIRAVLLSFLAVGPSAGVAWADPWPAFRGPTRQGFSKEIRLPVSWSASAVLWRTPVPGEGWSSPVVWGGRVFVTTARDEGRSCHVVALDRRTGEVLWDTLVFTQVLKRKESRNSYATPTPVTDGARVYASFGDGSFAAVDVISGKVVWTNRDYPFYGHHGLGTSLVLYRDTLIMARDGSSEGADQTIGWQTPWDQSFVIALDARTGRQLWKATRGLSRIAHVTPIVARIGARDVLVSPAGDVIQGFDLGTGARLWSVASPGEGVVPSPVVAGSLVITVSGFGAPTVRAVRLGATPVVAWEQTQGVPMQASPVATDGWVFVVSDAGVLSALDQTTGAQVWQQRLEGAFSASPVVADGKLYLLNESCETFVVAPAAAYALLSRNPLEGRCQASMAVSGGVLFIRNDSSVYAIGQVR